MHTRQPKILQLGKFYPILGGVEKVMYDLSTGLSGRGIRCDMLCASSYGGSRTIALDGLSRVIVCHTWFSASGTMIAPGMASALSRLCREYDIIHVHHPDPMACLALYLSGYKGKVVLHWHSDILKQKSMLRFYRPLQDWLIRRADVIVGTTPVYLSGSPWLSGVQHKTACLPIGVDMRLPDEKQVACLRQRYAGKKVIFSLGRLVPYKGYKYLVDAARHLSDDYVVLIGGHGPLFYDLMAEIETWGLEDKVKLLGHIPDEELPAYFGACDLFCLSSVQKNEAFGIVQIEAMSLGKPVVATRIPHSGVSWVNAHGVSGLNVEPCDSLRLAEAIRAVLSDESAYAAYSEGARRRYRELFTKEMMIDKVITIYDKLWKE